MLKISFRSKVILVLIAVVTTLLVYTIIEQIRSTKGIAYHSDMLFWQKVIIEELQEYYQKEGNYPESLQLIKDAVLSGGFVSSVPEEHKDGHILNEFQYSTDGNSYTMILEVEQYKHIYEGRKGKQVWYEYYINGEKFSRKKLIYPNNRNSE